MIPKHNSSMYGEVKNTSLPYVDHKQVTRGETLTGPRRFLWPAARHLLLPFLSLNFQSQWKGERHRKREYKDKWEEGRWRVTSFLCKRKCCEEERDSGNECTKQKGSFSKDTRVPFSLFGGWEKFHAANIWLHYIMPSAAPSIAFFPRKRLAKRGNFFMTPVWCSHIPSPNSRVAILIHWLFARSRSLAPSRETFAPSQSWFSCCRIFVCNAVQLGISRCTLSLKFPYGIQNLLDKN